MALSPDEKFIYVNPDTTDGEYNLAQYFPVKYIRGLECANAANFYIYFRGPKDATSTRLTVSLTSGFIKEFFTQFVDEINFGEKSVITLADRNASVDATTGGTDFQHVNADVSSVIISDALTIGYEDVQITEDLVVGGTITGSLVDGVYVNIDQEITSKTQINKRKFDYVSTAAGDCEGDIVYFGANASSHTAGYIYTLNASNQWVTADANSSATSVGLLAVAMGSAASSGMCIRGMVSLAVTHAGSPTNNSVLFLDSVTAGGVNATRPTGSGDIIRVVGYKMGNGKRMWFNPASTFTEV
tara:strand:+ start:139 stop:1038 length:900 start_codon:yes stop_codon:yes gene_type:complete